MSNFVGAGKFNIDLQYMRLAVPLVLFSFPVKVVSLVVLPLWILYEVSRQVVDKKIVLIFLGFGFLNLISVVVFHGFVFLLNSVFEHYMILQVAFSIFSVFFNLAMGRSFDVSFGDVVAGTFRNPFEYKADSSNVMFVFTMVLVSVLYVVYFGRAANKILLLNVFFVIFLASVNHLIMAVVFSFGIIFFSGKSGFLFKVGYFFAIFIVLLLILYLYSVFQPLNFILVVDRFGYLYDVVLGNDDLAGLGFKGEYLSNFLRDFSSNWVKEIFIGDGAGVYSSRASLFMTGEYVGGFGYANISESMFGNTYPLWVDMKEAPPWLAGAFNYPYSSIFSFFYELGLVFTLLIFIFFYRRIKYLGFLESKGYMFILIFLVLAGLVDNYYEYFQSFVIFFILTDALSKSWREYELE